MLAAVAVACAVASAPALADSSQPVGLTAVARSDHRVDLSWSWPASPTYPDELDVYRDGVFDSTVSPPSATSFQDTVATPGSSHTYTLVTVTGGVAGTPTAPTPSVTLRADLPNKPTNVNATFAVGSNIATVTWTRGAQDADVTYTVTAQQLGGGPLNTRTVRYATDGTSGSLTMDGFTSFTSYVFSVSAVEDVGDPQGDPGGTVAADSTDTETSYDVISPQFNGGLVTATTVSLGTITATWPAASDSGSGVQSYNVCVDGAAFCKTVAFDPLSPTQSAEPGAGSIRNDGQIHSVSVVAVDAQGNQSTPIATQITMPLLAKPALSLSAVDGCSPLIATASSSDSPTPTFHLFVNGASTETQLGQPIAGAPFQQVTLVATATFGSDQSPPSDPVTARVEDPTGPDTSPQVHGAADAPSKTMALTWNSITASSGAPVIGYEVTSSDIPGYGNGVFVPQSDSPGATLTNLDVSVGYLVAVSTVDQCLRQSPVTDAFLFRLNDDVAPSTPVLNTPVTTGNSVSLSWSPSTDNVKVDDYLIYRNGGLVGRTPGTSFTDTGLPDFHAFTYTVVAEDTASNRSAPSTGKVATTKDVTPPGPPGPLRGVPQDGSVTLSWGAASDNVAVTGYQLLRNGSTVVYQGTSLSYVDKNVPAGDYTYSVRAFDAAGLFSTARSDDVTSTGTPKATAASFVTLVKSKGSKMLKVGGKMGSRVVLSFKLTQPFGRAVLQLRVLASTAKSSKFSPKVRVSLPAGSGRNTPGTRLAERVAKKGVVTIPLGAQKAGTLRLVVTATGGVLTLAGTGSGTKAPTITTAP